MEVPDDPPPVSALGAAGDLLLAPMPDSPDDLHRWLDRQLEAFVEVHTAAGAKQRGAKWRQLMGETVGGSELAALLRMSPYKSFYDVVEEKLAAQTGAAGGFDGGGPACWWGTLFEGVIELVVAADLGSPLRGTDICIRATPGHRTSPDGYLVVRVAPGEGPGLWTTDRGPPPETCVPLVALVEFKCPYSRRPDGAVPKHYRPQVWSGLSVSPLAHFGLFVDSVFRKCSLEALGPGPEYDREYHRAKSDQAPWGDPFAWGLIAVYAPRLDAPRRVRMGWRGEEWAPGDPDPGAPDADASLAAWQVHSACLGMSSRAGGADASLDAADLGECPPKVFDRALGLIDRRRFPVRLAPPTFADGRGARGGLAAAVREFHGNPPAGHWLLGLLPWKLFEVNYVPVAPRPGFADEIAPLVAGVHAAVAAARAAPDPEDWLRQARAADPKKSRARRGQEDTRGTFYGGDEAQQDLFDSLGD